MSPADRRKKDAEPSPVQAGLDAVDLADPVEVPRKVALQMSLAVKAMHKLAAESMAEISRSLGLVARRKPPPDHSPCTGCGTEVQVGLPHTEDCTRSEAVRLRQGDDLPGVVED